VPLKMVGDPVIPLPHQSKASVSTQPQPLEVSPEPKLQDEPVPHGLHELDWKSPYAAECSAEPGTLNSGW